jgi:hypothetical protein
MKRLLLAFGLLTTTAFGQSNLTSVQDGDFFAIGTWNCICIPADGDTLVINHDINMNLGIPYTAGQITITVNGSLSDGGVDKDIYINGGTFINHGSVSLDGFWLDSGYVQNTGDMTLDSLWTQDLVDNTGTITVYDFLHDEDSTFNNNGNIEVTNNFTNQGHYYNNSTMSVANDAANCNIQTKDAIFFNNGILCISGNFSNCGDDTLKGSGEMYIAGSSNNLGRVEGTMDINTPTSGFVVNTGTVGGMVNFSNATCVLGAEELAIEPIFIYPNPAEDILNVSAQYISYQIYDISGRKVLSGTSISGIIGVDELKSGTYLLLIEGQEVSPFKQTFVKL